MAKVLVVDDDLRMVEMVTGVLRAEGHEVFGYTNGLAALQGIESHAPELVIADLNLEKSPRQGLEILQRARGLAPPAVVIVITAFGTVETAVEAMKRGAFDYLEKPFKLEEFKLCTQRALAYNQAVSENFFLKRQLKDKYHLNRIIGTSGRMQEVFRMIERVADTDSTVLVLGESGTGKELVARALHFNSRRQFAPFVPINCSALPENLLESELFGHRKGAFTGAVNDKKGLFAEAEGGTIFLDEIGCMSPQLQSRLLRVLQDKEVRRVGDNTPIYVNVRVLAATNAPLEQKIKDGTFREDLYYRLNVIAIPLPALRERRDDVPLLVAHFLRSKAHPHTGKAFQVTKTAMEALCGYDWPGNVRELENVVERACILSEKEVIGVTDLPPALQAGAPGESSSSGAGDGTMFELPAAPAGTETTKAPAGASGGGSFGPLKDFMREQEQAYLHRVMAQAGGNKEKAAEMLGISLATLYRKMAGEE